MLWSSGSVSTSHHAVKYIALDKSRLGLKKSKCKCVCVRMWLTLCGDRVNKSGTLLLHSWAISSRRKILSCSKSERATVYFSLRRYGGKVSKRKQAGALPLPESSRRELLHICFAEETAIEQQMWNECGHFDSAHCFHRCLIMQGLNRGEKNGATSCPICLILFPLLARNWHLCCFSPHALSW